MNAESISNISLETERQIYNILANNRVEDLKRFLNTLLSKLQSQDFNNLKITSKMSDVETSSIKEFSLSTIFSKFIILKNSKEKLYELIEECIS